MSGQISQLYPDSGSANAEKIQGIPVSGRAPTDGQALVFDSTIQEYVPKNLATFTSPDGSHWRLSVTNDGQIERTKI